MPPKKSKEPQSVPSPLVGDPNDPLTCVVNLVDKKVRNLEKRKTKLETLKAISEEGKSLDKDQKAAVEKIASVDEQLAVLKDLQKSIVSVQQESMKQKKKQLKAEQQQQKGSQREHMLKGISHALKITSALNLIDDTAKEDLKEGRNGAPHFSDLELGALDQFYQLVNPHRSGEEPFDPLLSEASQHLILCFEGSPREVPEAEGMTYESVARMLSTLEDSGYLVSLAEAAEEVEGEDEGIGGEGGEVEEDYDVIEDRDVPSNEEVQVVIEQYQKQQLQMQQVSTGGVVQGQIGESPPTVTGLMSASEGTFPQPHTVDFPGLDPNCGENPSFSFVHESHMIVTTVEPTEVPALMDLPVEQIIPVGGGDGNVLPPHTSGEVVKTDVPSQEPLPSYDLKSHPVPRAPQEGTYAALASSGRGQDKTSHSYSAATQSKVFTQENRGRDYMGPDSGSHDYSGQPREPASRDHGSHREYGSRDRDGGRRDYRGRSSGGYRGKSGGYRGDRKGGPSSHNGSGGSGWGQRGGSGSSGTSNRGRR